MVFPITDPLTDFGAGDTAEMVDSTRDEMSNAGDGFSSDPPKLKLGSSRGVG